MYQIHGTFASEDIREKTFKLPGHVFPKKKHPVGLKRLEYLVNREQSRLDPRKANIAGRPFDGLLSPNKPTVLIAGRN